jgi:hypothetical protein
VVSCLAVTTFFAAPSLAQPQEDSPTLAQMFEESLAQDGLETALLRLESAIADTTEPHAIDPYELVLGLPSRLVVQRQRDAALGLIRTLEPLFGNDGRYWLERAQAYLRCAEASATRAALLKAQEMSLDRPDIPWMLENLDALVANARLQAQLEDRLVPGESTGLEGPFLGQTPPGTIPEVFAPGILSSTAHEYHLSFAPDGREIYFSRGGLGTLVTRWKEDGWTAPEVIHFIDEDHLTEEANLSPDGRSVVFCARREIRAPRVLYRAIRTDEGWAEPVELFPGMYATSTLDGTLYYTREGVPPDYGAIVMRRWNGQSYGEPELVPGEGINTDAPDAHPFITSDENTLLFDSYRRPGAGIYASFRTADGGWSDAVRLNDRLGIPPVGQCALSPGGEFLFFCLAGDMYWVDARFLWELRAELTKAG